ncbi:MAG TPA: glycosyltransferase family 1 protein [Terracidiphilus sp.]|jgi:glycosyltransferase involved in cell wall biosynthesis
MKVVIALASSSGQLSGVPRHGINLARCLLTRGEISEVHLVVAPWQIGFVQDSAPWDDARLKLHAAPIGNSALSRNLWFYAQLPKLATRLDANIVHLAYPAPVRRGAFRCPAVVTLHDLYPYDIPENFGFPKIFFNRAVLRRCLRRIDAIACVSQSTFRRLESLDPALAGKTTVIHNAVEPQPRSATETPLPEWEGQPFLLCVAQHRRNKNILVALRVFDRLLQARQIPVETRLFIVGITGPETSAIKDFVAAAALEDRVLLLNGISDAQLQWCYRHCELVLAPSVLEGFGLPVAEALLAGCRVVCSDIAAFRELGGNHCNFVPLGPREVEAFADAVRATLLQESPGPIALPQLSSQIIAEAYMRLYQSLMLASAQNTSSNQARFQASEKRRHLL